MCSIRSRPCHPTGARGGDRVCPTCCAPPTAHWCTNSPTHAATCPATCGQGCRALPAFGHCVTSGSAGRAGFLLSDELGEYGVGRPNRFRLPLGAADLLRGTLNDDSDQARGERAVAHAAARGGGRLRVRCGHDRPRAVRVRHLLLIDGADTVQATLWSLPTDAALQAMDASAGPALTRLAVAVDAAQTADDPVASLCSWQRGSWTPGVPPPASTTHRSAGSISASFSYYY